MGKIRTRIIGLEEVEEKQKKEQKERSKEKKLVSKVKEPASAKVSGGKEKNIASVPPSPKTVSKKRVGLQRTRGKNYQKARKEIDKTKTYTLTEAIGLLKKLKYTKFDESVELHLNVDSAGLKGEIDLPHSTGKITKVKIVDDTVLADIEKGKIDFDILVTHPSYMPKLAKFAKILGPKGLMPNPKAGTISPKPEELLKKFAKGMLRFKTEPKAPIIHQMIGKISFAEKDLSENAEKFVATVGKNHITSVFIKSTMSPSLRLDLNKI